LEGLLFLKPKYKILDYMNTQIALQVKEIDVEQLHTMITKGAEFQLIDVREPDERLLANLGGDLIPLDSLVENIDKINQKLPVIIYCRTGRRSTDAVFILQQAYGFDNVYNLKGGIHAWSDAIDPGVTKY
jgi:rhodanese-related sulfurtransferase